MLIIGLDIRGFCENSADLIRIKPPLREWEARGLVTFVDAKAIPPELPAMWLKNEAAKRGSQILKVGLDKYRCNVLRNACMDFMQLNDDQIYLVRPSDEMQIVPTLTDKFATQKLSGAKITVICVGRPIIQRRQPAEQAILPIKK